MLSVQEIIGYLNSFTENEKVIEPRANGRKPIRKFGLKIQLTLMIT